MINYFSKFFKRFQISKLLTQLIKVNVIFYTYIFLIYCENNASLERANNFLDDTNMCKLKILFVSNNDDDKITFIESLRLAPIKIITKVSTGNVLPGIV